jgi:hypothetical protein
MSKARDIASAAPAPSTVSATELGYVDGVTSAIQTQLDAKTAKSTLTTTGDIYYASSANTPARLGIGSTGNVLTVASGIPSWTAPAAGGKVLQVVEGTLTGEFSSSNNGFHDIGLSVSITPSSASSKVLVFATIGVFRKQQYNSSNGAVFKLLRDSTDIARVNNIGHTGANELDNAGSVTMNKLDSPATTSAITYKVQGRNNNADYAYYINLQDNSGNNSSISTIIAMEIGA